MAKSSLHPVMVRDAGKVHWTKVERWVSRSGQAGTGRESIVCDLLA
ncbi:hypothetical protein [Akkermansia glycaniphila]|nr:hypothetical protein [Akkermansia glycaniphila]MBT9448735.1 hypothetical protein [Akkermansia glycaniphila]